MREHPASRHGVLDRPSVTVSSDDCGRPVGSAAKLSEHLVVLGEAAGLELAEDQLAVDADVEDAAAALDQLGLDAELALDCVRQTGGLGKVVSLAAVLDRHFHVVFSRFRSRAYSTAAIADFHARC